MVGQLNNNNNRYIYGYIIQILSNRNFFVYKLANNSSGWLKFGTFKIWTYRVKFTRTNIKLYEIYTLEIEQFENITYLIHLGGVV